MSDSFWAKKLNQGRPAPLELPYSIPQQHAPANSRPWWDQSAPVEIQPGYGPSAQAQVLYDAQGNAVLVGPNGQVLAVQGTPGDLSPEEIARHTKSARKAKSTETCPECGSGNYTIIGSKFTKNGEVETKRCFTCGYPVVQRGSGMSGLTTGKATGTARQVAHGGIENGFTSTVVGVNGQPVLAPTPAFAAEHGGPGR